MQHSKWMSEQGQKFAWQEGYSGFSVSASNITAVITYMQNQKAIIKNAIRRGIYRIVEETCVDFDPKYVFG